MLCPVCVTPTLEPGDGVFYERGEWDGKAYAEEGNVPTYTCTGCGLEIAIVQEAKEAEYG
jgi:hypothetical protein